jgi:hypothetical protein
MSDILRRIERAAGVEHLVTILADRLDPTDLQSLLLEVYRRRSERKSPAALLSEYETNRFVRPAPADPAALLEWERIAFATLPDEFVAMDLSPVCPLGTSAAVAAVSQNCALATSRNTEVVSDTTNVLALESAARRRELLRGDARSASTVRLAASQRVLRAQHYQDPRLLPHFQLFALVSAGRDPGAGAFEVEALSQHVRFYVRALRRFLGNGVPLRVSVTDLESDPPRERWQQDRLQQLAAGLPDVEIRSDPARSTGRGYYLDVCFHVHAASESGEWVELADGGAVDWTRKLLSNAKERLMISGIGSERVVARFARASA